MATVNFISIQRKIDQALKNGLKSREIIAKLKIDGDEAARIIVGRLHKEFDGHKVTKELLNGPAETTSLPEFATRNGKKYGNIAAFFGIPPSRTQEDLKILKNLLAQFTVEVNRLANGKYSVHIRFSPLSTYYNATPAVGYQGSWLKAMEKALLNNFTHFLFRPKGIPSSVSGTGIQVKNSLKRGMKSPKEIPYITSIYQAILGNENIAKRMLKTTINKLSR